MGKNRPQRNIMGKRKKLEKVCASKTSLTETAMKSPTKVELIAINRRLGITCHQSMPDRSIRREATSMGTIALRMPITIAPDVLAIMSVSNGIGASRRRSNDFAFFSKVMVTANMEVVPKRMESERMPGRISRMVLIENAEPPIEDDLMKNIKVHARGKIMPQLRFGGFR